MMGVPPHSLPPMPPALRTVGVTLLGHDMSFVQDVRIPYPRGGYPDAIQWQGRLFGRERVHEPNGIRRWHYVEMTCAVALLE